MRISIAGAAFAVAFVSSYAMVGSGAARAYEPQTPECVAPANPGGGWDFTCRETRKIIRALGLLEMWLEVLNLPGEGGGYAFAEVVTKRHDDNDLIVAASTATTTRLAQGAYGDFSADQVRWLGALGADYGVIAVSTDNRIQSLDELMSAVRDFPGAIVFAGGSAAGGWDHLKALMVARAAGVEDIAAVQYRGYQGGGEAVAELVGGYAHAFSGDISEALDFAESGDIRIIAVLAPQRLPGELADIPTAREQGIDAIGANWRGFYAPAGMSEEAYAYWSDVVSQVGASEEWAQAMAENGLRPFRINGAELTQFVAQQVQEIKELTEAVGLE